MYYEAYKISKIQELPRASLPGSLPGLCPGPTGGLKAAPRPPASNSVAPPLTSILRSATMILLLL
jgi:hypothetical protein